MEYNGGQELIIDDEGEEGEGEDGGWVDTHHFADKVDENVLFFPLFWRIF